MCELPWASPTDCLLGRRCDARREPRPDEDRWGRCELRDHPPDVHHAIENGMVDVLRWSTNWTNPGAEQQPDPATLQRWAKQLSTLAEHAIPSPNARDAATEMASEIKRHTPKDTP